MRQGGIELVEWIRGPGDRGQGTGDMDIAYIAYILHFCMSNIPATCLFQEQKAPAACSLSHKKGSHSQYSHSQY